MKKSIPQIQYSRLLALFHKLQARLNRNFRTGRFHQFTYTQQQRLLQRIEKLKGQLSLLERGLHWTGTAMAAAALLYTPSAAAQYVSSAGEFLVNTYTSGDQQLPSLAYDANGNYIITWQSFGQDGDRGGIFAQRYNASGTKAGSEFLVNTATSFGQASPAVAVDNSGNFLITWTSNDRDGDGYGIYAQRYDPSGTAVGGEFQVNDTTAGDQTSPALAMNGNGDFVISWESINLSDPSSTLDVYAKAYSASGTAKGNDFLVNTYTTDKQYNATVAIDATGDFIVAWQSRYQDGDQNGVYAQRFDVSGTATGTAFLVNSYTTSDQGNPDVVMDDSGDFILTWNSYSQDGDRYGIYARRYDATGTAFGNEFLVNTYTTDGQYQPAIAMDPSTHDFVITWLSFGEDGAGYGIYAQGYYASGTVKGDEFRVNNYTTDLQRNADVALDANGDLLIVWQSYGQEGKYDDDIFARHYVNVITSTSSSTAAASFNFYPNPAKDQVNLVFEGTEEIQVNVMSIEGVLLQSQLVTNKTLLLGPLKAGVYLLEFSKDDAVTERKKLVIE